MGSRILTKKHLSPIHFATIPPISYIGLAISGRILEDGNYEFLGRSDSQIKLRGIRIELSEIEAVIRTCPQIQDCVVAALEAPSGEKSLCAYYVSSAQVNSADLRDFVGQRLPEYMRPAAYVELTKLPLLSNGKVDRSQLPAPQQWLQGGHLPPASAVEEILCGIWEEILRLEKVGVEDNFFELGGHSLMATQVISRVRHVFNCEVSLRAFLQQPTIRKLAHEVEQQTQDPTLKMVTPISVVSRKESGTAVVLCAAAVVVSGADGRSQRYLSHTGCTAAAGRTG